MHTCRTCTLTQEPTLFKNRAVHVRSSRDTIAPLARRRLARPPCRLPPNPANLAHLQGHSTLAHPVDIALDVISLSLVHLCTYFFPIAREKLHASTLVHVATSTLFPVVGRTWTYIQESDGRAKAKQIVRDAMREFTASAILFLELAVLCANLLRIALHGLSRGLLCVWKKRPKRCILLALATPLFTAAWTTLCGSLTDLRGSFAGMLVAVYALLPRRLTTSKVMATIYLFSAVALIGNLVTSPFDLQLSSSTFATNWTMTLVPVSPTSTLPFYYPTLFFGKMGPPSPRSPLKSRRTARPPGIQISPLARPTKPSLPARTQKPIYHTDEFYHALAGCDDARLDSVSRLVAGMQAQARAKTHPTKGSI